MCGICGVMRGDAGGDADRALVERMNASLIHRGPDDAGVFADGPCALGARRLSVIDVEHGHQPMVSDDGRYAVVFNGEIYNASELRAELAGLGHAFRTRCDTEVLLHGCMQWGETAVERLNGMFAFAFYDAETKRLLLARDRLGIKPLFVCEHEGSIYFASELDALLRAGVVSGKLDAASLDAYFTYLYVPGPETIYSNVAQLEPGQILVHQNGESERHTYWRPSYGGDASWTLGRAAAAYKELLCDAVRMQRVSDVPLGAFLSGGMDSATVVAAMTEFGDVSADTFTIGFDDPAADERAYADAVAKQFGTNHTSAVMDPDLVHLLPELVPHFGQPFADSSAVPTYLVSKLAREAVTVALSGDGGDELFAGYSWLHMTRRVEGWRMVPRPIRRLANAAASLGSGSPALERMRRFTLDSLGTPRETFRRRTTCFYPEERTRLYRPAVRAAIDGQVRDRFAEVWESAGVPSDDVRMLRQDLSVYLPDDILTKVDRMSMAVSLEVRVPLLDHRVVEFANALPFHLKYDRGESKRVPKHAFRGVLPEPVLKQRKRGFAIPVDRWFRERLHGYFLETVLASESRVRAWLNPAELNRIWEAHQSGRRNVGHRLWCVLAFELWLRYVADYVDIGVE